jgi:hypothetical protein
MAFLRVFTEAQYQGIMQVAEAFTMLERQGPYRKFRVAASGTAVYYVDARYSFRHLV